jgi:hypothetical protein
MTETATTTGTAMMGDTAIGTWAARTVIGISGIAIGTCGTATIYRRPTAVRATGTRANAIARRMTGGLPVSTKERCNPDQTRSCFVGRAVFSLFQSLFLLLG